MNFKGNGEARFIEARMIREDIEKDALFEDVPKGESDDMRELIVEAVTREGATKLSDLIGLWPGDETSEELLAGLKG